MEPQNINQDVEQTNQVTQTSRLHQVTPISKYLAMILFIILPFLGAWIGYTSAPETAVDVERVVYIESDVVAPDAHPKLAVYLNSENELLVAQYGLATTSTMILEVPDNTEVFDQHFSEDKVVFVIQTHLNIGGWGPEMFIAFMYDKQTGDIERLFTSNDMDTDRRYIRIGEAIDVANRLLEFTVYGCWGCGGHQPHRYLYDTRIPVQSRYIGTVAEFELLADGNYRYKPFGDSDDSNLVCLESGPCVYHTTDHIDWVDASVDDRRF